MAAPPAEPDGRAPRPEGGADTGDTARAGGASAAAGAGRWAEPARKLIHVVASLGAAAVVAWRPPTEAAAVLAAATLVALTVELLRRVSPRFSGRFRATLGGMMRAREARRLTGATTLSVGYTLAAVLLPGRPALAGILLTGVADAGAALVGKRFGSIRYPGGKSVQGSAAFFVLAVGIVGWVGGAGIGVTLAAATAVTLLEAPSLDVDDNLYLPLVAAATLRAVLWLSGSGRFS